MSLDDAVLRWGISNQTNARSHNPAAINFLAAGVADPGRGGVALRQSQWRAKQDDVTIEKRTSDGDWRTATWDGLGTSPAGDPVGVYGPFSDHAVVLHRGTGTLDRSTGDASVTWKGTFTVVYYGGNTIFTMTDPTLRIDKGVGTLTATLGGYLADRNDPTVWQPATPKRVRVADLPDVELGARGFTATPAYAGVAVTGTEPQDRTSADWGAFPQPFVSYLRPFGIDQFWYSTGLQSDTTKAPLPLTVSYSAKEVVAPSETASPTLLPELNNSAPAAPTPDQAPVAAPVPPVAAPLDPPAAGPVPTAPPSGASVVSTIPSAAQLVAASTATAAPGATAAEARPQAGWFIGGALLLVTAVVLLVPTPRPASSGTPSRR